MSTAEAAGALRDEVAGLQWYHTLELAPGVVTPGYYDTRHVVDAIDFPATLAGKRCLDVGTFDGFWAFEMERRGAAEVVAIDLLQPEAHDWPPDYTEEMVALLMERKGTGRGFEVAREALGSSVRRVERSIYDLDPAEDGMFDFVYVGSLLLHLRDPVRALDRVRRVCSGEVMIVDAVDLTLTLLTPRRPSATLDGRGRPWWWMPNLAGLRRMVEAAGMTVVAAPRLVFMPFGQGELAGRPSPAQLLRNAPRLALTRGGRRFLLRTLKGDAHGALRARPRRPSPASEAA